MEEAKNAGNGGDAVKKKSFLMKIIISKWFFLTVFILGISGYAAWWGMNWWADYSAEKDVETHNSPIAQETDAAPDLLHEAVTDETHSVLPLTTHQPTAQNHDSQKTAQHVADPLNHTASETDTAFNKTAHETKVTIHSTAAPTAGHVTPVAEQAAPAVEHATPTVEHGTTHAAPVRTGPRGVAFVEACIQPLDYELNHRFLGWRPNDIIRIADNIKNLQLGVLEVTRRTAVALAENLSRTGSTDAYVPSLEYAMNAFMIKPSEFMFPSAEGKYQEGLDGWRNYQNMLNRGEEHFYRRVDNLVPLFKAYESILGSCDENLVKNVGKMSTFKADDIFYYTKGVASCMGTILAAVAVDCDDTIGSVQGMDVLHHAIDALHHASSLEPWIVLEGSPDGILANHRANIAAPISHARFYLDVLSRSLTGNL
ncbi:DUF2333 family protein [Desulfobacter curvatus]|uniref:DUF2333 family protein n=1 Tax=Desulfobacter curvatus TaxID=2290 RepID=UPI0005244D0F|nr:DUF2333 family protein [Desulfobacter curvatus]